jgi:hypothetical protein
MYPRKKETIIQENSIQKKMLQNCLLKDFLLSKKSKNLCKVDLREGAMLSQWDYHMMVDSDP